MMNPASSVSGALGTVELGQLATFRNLSIVPLLATRAYEPDYLTLDEALAGGWVSITEVGETGHVPELTLTNRGAKPVLLIDGEELVGAKQNRVLNLTILVAAMKTMTIPVSCVEAGRWRHVSRGFQSAPRAQFAEGRAAKMRNVSDSLRHSGERQSNQGEVWGHIAEKSARLGAQSDTSAMSAMYEQMHAPIESFVEAFPSDERQAGAVVFVNGRLVGLELFDAPVTWRKLAPKLLRSYAVDAIDRGSEGSSSPLADEAQRFMVSTADSEASAYPATGVGEDVRLSGARLSGAALVVDERTVHLSAFSHIEGA